MPNQTMWQNRANRENQHQQHRNGKHSSNSNTSKVVALQPEEWWTMIARWDRDPTANHARVLNQVLYANGVPKSVRRGLWFVSSGAAALKAANPGKFKALVEKPFDANKTRVEYQIWKDVHRTFPLFRTSLPSGAKLTTRADGGVPGQGAYEEHELALFRVLKAVAMTDIDSGYHQGLNFIAAVALLVLRVDTAEPPGTENGSEHQQQTRKSTRSRRSRRRKPNQKTRQQQQQQQQQHSSYGDINEIGESEDRRRQSDSSERKSSNTKNVSTAWREASEDAYWLMQALFTDYSLAGLYRHSSSFLQQFIDQFETLFRRFLPRLYRHLYISMEPRFEVVLFGVDWFTTLFSYSMRFDTMLVVWDCFIAARLDEGLYVCGLATLLALIKPLESLECFADVMPHFKPLVQSLTPQDLTDAICSVVERLVPSTLIPRGSSTLRDITLRLGDAGNLVSRDQYDARSLVNAVQIGDAISVLTELDKYSYPSALLEHALLRAVFLGHSDVVLALLDAGGCDPDCRSTLSFQQLSSTVADTTSETTSNDGRSEGKRSSGRSSPLPFLSLLPTREGAITPLHLCAVLGNPTVARVLIAQGAKHSTLCTEAPLVSLVVLARKVTEGRHLSHPWLKHWLESNSGDVLSLSGAEDSDLPNNNLNNNINNNNRDNHNNINNHDNNNSYSISLALGDPNALWVGESEVRAPRKLGKDEETRIRRVADEYEFSLSTSSPSGDAVAGAVASTAAGVAAGGHTAGAIVSGVVSTVASAAAGASAAGIVAGVVVGSVAGAAAGVGVIGALASAGAGAVAGAVADGNDSSETDVDGNGSFNDSIIPGDVSNADAIDDSAYVSDDESDESDTKLVNTDTMDDEDDSTVDSDSIQSDVIDPLLDLPSPFNIDGEPEAILGAGVTPLQISDAISTLCNIGESATRHWTHMKNGSSTTRTKRTPATAAATSQIPPPPKSAVGRVLGGEVCVQCGQILRPKTDGWWSSVVSAFTREPHALPRADLAKLSRAHGIAELPYIPPLCSECANEWLSGWTPTPETPTSVGTAGSAETTESSREQLNWGLSRKKAKPWQNVQECALDLPGHLNTAWRCQHCYVCFNSAAAPPTTGTRASRGRSGGLQQPRNTSTRYQCKRCNYWFCGTCADTLRVLKPKYPTKPVRVCRSCHHVLRSCPCLGDIGGGADSFEGDERGTCRSAYGLDIPSDRSVTNRSVRSFGSHVTVGSSFSFATAPTTADFGQGRRFAGAWDSRTVSSIAGQSLYTQSEWPLEDVSEFCTHSPVDLARVGRLRAKQHAQNRHGRGNYSSKSGRVAVFCSCAQCALRRFVAFEPLVMAEGARYQRKLGEYRQGVCLGRIGSCPESSDDVSSTAHKEGNESGYKPLQGSLESLKEGASGASVFTGENGNKMLDSVDRASLSMSIAQQAGVTSSEKLIPQAVLEGCGHSLLQNEMSSAFSVASTRLQVIGEDDQTTARRYVLGMLLLCHSQITQRCDSVMRRDLGLRDPVGLGQVMSPKKKHPNEELNEVKTMIDNAEYVVPEVEVLGGIEGGKQQTNSDGGGNETIRSFRYDPKPNMPGSKRGDSGVGVSMQAIDEKTRLKLVCEKYGLDLSVSAGVDVEKQSNEVSVFRRRASGGSSRGKNADIDERVKSESAVSGDDSASINDGGQRAKMLQEVCAKYGVNLR